LLIANRRWVDQMAPDIRQSAYGGQVGNRKFGLVRSFSHRNYRLFFMGQGVSLIGTQMQNLALSWLVYRLTGSMLLLGVVGFSSQILIFVAAPFAGVLADRVNRRALLVVTQSVATVQALILAILTLMKHADGTPLIQVWHIVALSALLGLVMGFDIPTRQSFVVEMIEDRADLPNAIALNSFMFNGARLVGPALAGVVIKLVGEGTCFLLNAVSFLAVIAALLAMKVQPKSAEAASRRALQSFKEGAQYVAGHKPILSLLLLLATLSLVGMPYAVLMPVFAKDILHGDSFTQGCLTSAVAAGAIVAAIFLASRKSVYGLGQILTAAVALFGAALLGFSHSTHLWLSLGLLGLAGAAGMSLMASCNTLIQTLVDDDKRGRVMSFYTISFVGLAPFGSLLVGALAARFGAPAAVAINGAGCLAAAVVFWMWLPRFLSLIHPVFVRMGIAAEE
jgi:MFS family permease